LTLTYPFWLKPVKATESMLSFLIHNKGEFADAIEEIKEEIDLLAKPFNEILAQGELSDEVADVDGYWCCAEKPLEGTQHTISGYVHNGQPHIYGVIDSLVYEETSSFLCYVYPSKLPDEVQERMEKRSCDIARQIGLDNCAFNIEYFYDSKNDHLGALEMNPRISQSHCEMYRRVDGESNQSIVIQLALGKQPEFSRGEGKQACSAKFYLRRFEDGQVNRIPTKEERESLEEEYDAQIHVIPSENEKLSEMLEHDTASFVLAEIFVGGDSRENLQKQFKEIGDKLQFKIS